MSAKETEQLRRTVAKFDMIKLRELRNLLKSDIERVAYWARLLESRIASLESGKGADQIPERILTVTAYQTLTFAEMLNYKGKMPTAKSKWSNAVKSNDIKATKMVIGESQKCLKMLDAYRDFLKERFSIVTEEMISRYRDDPSLIETLLPKTPNRTEYL